MVYSPELINPGDKTRRLSNIKKVTSGSTPQAAQFIDELYRSIIPAGTHLASSIKVTEAAKVIENAQRDINIAFVNELSKIFHLLDIDTNEVLEAADAVKTQANIGKPLRHTPLQNMLMSFKRMFLPKHTDCKPLACGTLMFSGRGKARRANMLP